LETALSLLDAGAARIGTSSGVSLYDAYLPEEDAAAKI
jgi:deoxyribose-phosphate aldolase